MKDISCFSGSFDITTNHLWYCFGLFEQDWNFIVQKSLIKFQDPLIVKRMLHLKPNPIFCLLLPSAICENATHRKFYPLYTICWSKNHFVLRLEITCTMRVCLVHTSVLETCFYSIGLFNAPWLTNVYQCKMK